MYSDKSFIAIIPARGDSTRLPRKNILDFCGKPLIAWSIEAGIKSKYIDHVMVTTDSNEIAKISEWYGANIPFIRPNKLADDYATRSDVIRHTIEFYQNMLKKNFDYLVFLQPTSPLRDSSHIDGAIDYMFSIGANAIVSVCELEHPMQWSGILPKDKNMSEFLDNVALKSRSQDLEKYYRLNGAIYICDVQRFLAEGCVFLSDNIYAFEMPTDVSIDIDTELDFKVAEALMSWKVFKDINGK